MKIRVQHNNKAHGTISPDTLKRACLQAGEALGIRVDIKPGSPRTMRDGTAEVEIKLFPISDSFRSCNPITGRRINAIHYIGWLAFMRKVYDLVLCILPITMEFVSCRGRIYGSELVDTTMVKQILDTPITGPAYGPIMASSYRAVMSVPLTEYDDIDSYSRSS